MTTFFCYSWNSDGKEGKNKEASGVASSSSSSAAKPKVKNTSSIAGIALCWQGVVQQQVIRQPIYMLTDDQVYKVLMPNLCVLPTNNVNFK